ncbi:hypothetical protein QF012_004836 [Pseudomonas laurylsulfatiphila]
MLTDRLPSPASRLLQGRCVQSRGLGRCFENYLKRIKNGKPEGFPFFISRLNQMTWTIASVTTSMLLWFSAATQMRPVSRA